jgi:hypothetical protein
MSNDLERVEHRQAEAKDKVEGKDQQPKPEEKVSKAKESGAKQDEKTSQQEQAEQYFKQMIDQSLGESRQRQASGTFGNGSAAMFSLSQASESQTNNNAGFANSKDANRSAASDESAPELVSTTTIPASAAVATATVAAATASAVPGASTASVPTLWTSEAAFFKSVDSFINKFKSTDSFAALAETHEFHSSNIEATEALREFLVSRSLQKDSVLSQEWVPQYEPATRTSTPPLCSRSSRLRCRSTRRRSRSRIASTKSRASARTRPFRPRALRG